MTELGMGRAVSAGDCTVLSTFGTSELSPKVTTSRAWPANSNLAPRKASVPTSYKRVSLLIGADQV